MKKYEIKIAGKKYRLTENIMMALYYFICEIERIKGNKQH